MRAVHNAAFVAFLLLTTSTSKVVAAELGSDCPAIPVDHLRNLESCLVVKSEERNQAYTCMRDLGECDQKADPISGVLQLDECYSTYSEYVASVGAGSCSAGEEVCSLLVSDLVDRSCTDLAICPTTNSTETLDGIVQCYRLGLATLEEQAICVDQQQDQCRDTSELQSYSECTSIKVSKALSWGNFRCETILAGTPFESQCDMNMRDFALAACGRSPGSWVLDGLGMQLPVEAFIGIGIAAVFLCVGCYFLFARRKGSHGKRHVLDSYDHGSVNASTRDMDIEGGKNGDAGGGGRNGGKRDGAARLLNRLSINMRRMPPGLFGATPPPVPPSRRSGGPVTGPPPGLGTERNLARSPHLPPSRVSSHPKPPTPPPSRKSGGIPTHASRNASSSSRKNNSGAKGSKSKEPKSKKNDRLEPKSKNKTKKKDRSRPTHTPEPPVVPRSRASGKVILSVPSTMPVSRPPNPMAGGGDGGLMAAIRARGGA